MTDALPPGISCESNFKYYASGGDKETWLSFPKVKHYTNAFIVQDDKVLLGYKKRGFGKGKYNGFGGKVEPGETPLQAAIRELKEESGITAPLEHAGSFLFFNEGAEWAFHIDIYTAESYDGIVTESDEMRPEWFSSLLSSSNCDDAMGNEKCLKYEDPGIPYEQMWETDLVWLPLLLSKKKFIGRADFVQSGEQLKPYKWWYGVVSMDAHSS